MPFTLARLLFFIRTQQATSYLLADAVFIARQQSVALPPALFISGSSYMQKPSKNAAAAVRLGAPAPSDMITIIIRRFAIRGL